MYTENKEGIKPYDSPFDNIDIKINYPQEEKIFSNQNMPLTAEELMNRNKDINFDLILNCLKDDKDDYNNCERNLESYPNKIDKNIKSEIPFGKTLPIKEKNINYMKKLVLNDITLSQIKYNYMKIDPKSVIHFNEFNEKTIKNTFNLILEEALISKYFYKNRCRNRRD